MSTPVTVTRPIRGSFSSGTASARTCRTDSFTRRIRSLIPYSSESPRGGNRQRLGTRVVRIDDEAVGERDLPLLPAQPALRLVEQPLDLAMLARDAGDRDPRALPDVVMVDLRNRRADTVLELRLRAAQEVPLLLQRMRRRESAARR